MIVDVLSEGSPDKNLTAKAVRFFGYKRGINWKKFVGIDKEEAIFRLQKRWPEFCLLFFWHNNGLSIQQENLLSTIDSNWMYTPKELMKAWWAVRYLITGPVFPILGYTKYMYEEAKKDKEQRVIASMIEKQMQKQNKELLWGQDIILDKGYYIVSYISRYIELLEFLRDELVGDIDNSTWNYFVSYWLFNEDTPVESGFNEINWPNLLLKTSFIGKKGQQVSDSVYSISKYYNRRYPFLFIYLEEKYKDFHLVFSKDEHEIRSIYQIAMRENRELTKIENDIIEEIRNPHSMTEEELRLQIDALKAKQVSNSNEIKTNEILEKLSLRRELRKNGKLNV